MQPKFPKEGASRKEYEAYHSAMEALKPQMSEINQQMTKSGHLTALFESLYTIGVGKEIKTNRGVNVDWSTTVSNLSQNNDGSYSFDIKSRDLWGLWKTEEGVTAGFDDTYTELERRNIVNDLGDIQKKRDQAIFDAANTIIQSVSNTYFPGSGTVIEFATSTIKTAIAPSESEVLNRINEGNEIVFGDNYDKMIKSGFGGASQTLSVVEEIQNLTQLERNAKESLKASLFDTGGRYGTEANGKRYVRFDPTYDLSTILNVHDLNENGLRGYVYRQEMAENGDSEDAYKAVIGFDKMMSSEENRENISFGESGLVNSRRNMTEDAYEFFSGNSHHTVSEIGAVDIYQGITDMEQNDFYQWGGKKGISEYFDSNNKYFNELVEIEEP